MNKKIRVLIADDIAETRNNLEKLLFFEENIEVIAKASNGLEAVELAKDLSPDVILMDVFMPGMDGITATKEIVNTCSNVAVIMMSVLGDSFNLAGSLKAGAKMFLIKPFSAEDLYHSITDVYKKIGEKVTTYGHIITVFSPKGGSGTSVLATNIAIAIHHITQKRVLVIDADASAGDQADLFGISPRNTMKDLISEDGNVISEMLEKVIESHTSGVYLLPSPSKPQEAECITVEILEGIVWKSSSKCDYVIIDTRSSYTDNSMAMLAIADQVIAVMTPEITSIKKMKTFIELTSLLGYFEKVFLLLNKFSEKMGLRIRNIEKDLQHAIDYRIANAPKEMVLSINLGLPIFLRHKEDYGISKDFLELAKILVENKAKSHPPVDYFKYYYEPNYSYYESSEVISIKRRRLQLLQEQAALFGIQCPPHILIEIEDLKNLLED